MTPIPSPRAVWMAVTGAAAGAVILAVIGVGFYLGEVDGGVPMADLVHSMIPARGVSLGFAVGGGEVVAALQLSEPVVRKPAAAAVTAD